MSAPPSAPPPPVAAPYDDGLLRLSEILGEATLPIDKRMLTLGIGRAAGAYGQMHCISLILQGLRDGWITDDTEHPTLARLALNRLSRRPGPGPRIAPRWSLVMYSTVLREMMRTPPSSPPTPPRS